MPLLPEGRLSRRARGFHDPRSSAALSASPHTLHRSRCYSNCILRKRSSRQEESRQPYRQRIGCLPLDSARSTSRAQDALAWIFHLRILAALAQGLRFCSLFSYSNKSRQQKRHSNCAKAKRVCVSVLARTRRCRQGERRNSIHSRGVSIRSERVIFARLVMTNRLILRGLTLAISHFSHFLNSTNH